MLLTAPQQALLLLEELPLEQKETAVALAVKVVKLELIMVEVVAVALVDTLALPLVVPGNRK